MKIMLSYYNDMTVFLSTIFNALKFDIDYMGRPSKKTIELSTKYSTESWCFDTKLMLGQAIEGIQRKNDIITMPGAWGGNNENCLLGYLSQGIMKKKLEQIAKKKIILWHFNLNPIELMFSGYYSLYKNIAQLKPYSKIRFFRTTVLNAIVLGTKKMALAAKLKEIVLNSPEIVETERLFRIYDDFIKDMVYKADNHEKAKRFFDDSIRQISGLKKERIKKKITVGIIGDYAHTLFGIFPFFDIEKFLLSEKVRVIQPLSFLNYFSFLSPIYSKKNREELRKLLPQSVTGSDAITILSAIYLKNKVDGLIHIGTFSCTPEEVANEVLISNKKKFPPVLSLSYDAHTTEENMRVRIEAFIDTIRSKK